jgi:hypothetical protein
LARLRSRPNHQSASRTSRLRSERLVACWRHVAHRAFEGSKNLMRGTFEVQIKIGRKRGRPALGDHGCDPSRMLIRRQGLRLGSGSSLPRIMRDAIWQPISVSSRRKAPREGDRLDVLLALSVCEAIILSRCSTMRLRNSAIPRQNWLRRLRASEILSACGYGRAL